MENRKLRKLKDKANTLLAKGKDKKALSIYSQILKDQPGDVAIMMKVGDLGRRLGMNELALSVYSRAAEAYALDGLLLRGIAVCKIILELAPTHNFTQERLADLYTKQYGYVPGRQNPESGALPAVAAVPASVPTSIDIDVEMDMKEPSVAPRTAAVVEDIEIEAVDEPRETMELGDDEIVVEEMDDEILEILDFDEDGEDIELEEEDIVLELPDLEPGMAADDLPRIPLLSDLTPDAFISFVNRVPLHRFSMDEYVVREGDEGGSFFVIVGGSVVVEKAGVEIAQLVEGSFFGEMALIAPGPRQASIRAAEDVELLEISQEELDQLSKEYPNVVEVMAGFTRERLLNNLTLTSPLFAPFSEGDRASLMQRFEEITCVAGDVVIEQGNPSTGLYMIALGEMEVIHADDGGGETVLSHLSEGGVFGEMSLLTHAPAVATVRAKRDGRLLKLSHMVFTEVIMTHPQVLELISQISDERSQENRQILEPALASDRGGGSALL